MAVRRKTDPAIGRAAVATWLAEQESLAEHQSPEISQQLSPADRQTMASAVRFTLEELADLAPGHTVEVRVAPYGAVQCVDGPKHTRGTPPNVVETDAQTWLALVTGILGWQDAIGQGKIHASGERADLSMWLPLQATKRR